MMEPIPSHKHTGIKDPTGRFERHEDFTKVCDSVICYRAYDVKTGLEVSWHEALFVPGTSKQDIDDTLNLMGQLQKLKHQSMNSLLHFWLSDDMSKYFYITESASGRSIYAHVCSNPESIRPRVLAKWFTPVLQVLVFLHGLQKPVIHNRLRLNNLFMKPMTGTVKLGSPAFSQHAVCGGGLTLHVEADTPPEYLFGTAAPYSDIWRFGIAVLSVAMRAIPYAECTNPAELIDKLMAYQPPACLSQVTDHLLLDMISSCLWRPLLRPTAAELLVHPFFTRISDDDDRSSERASERDDDIVVIFSGKPTRSNQQLPSIDTGLGLQSSAELSVSQPRINSGRSTTSPRPL